MKQNALFYVADETAAENQCKYRISKLNFNPKLNRTAAFIPHTDTLYVVEKKLNLGATKVWMKRKQFVNLEDAQSYVTRKATPLVG